LLAARNDSLDVELHPTDAHDIVQVVDPDGEGGTLMANALRPVRGLPHSS
jgi:hypothetical protein